MMAESQEQLDLEHFRSIPWCKSLLEDPDFVYAPTVSRQPKESTEDAFFAEALQTPHTVSRCLSMYRKPHGPGNNERMIKEVRTLLQLGYQLAGFPRVVHGGFSCFIMDEIAGLLLTYNKDLGTLPHSLPTFTVSLNVTFLKQVEAPGTVLVVARIKEVKGRKHFIETTVQDEDGAVCARADALFIAAQASRDEKL